jgi:hypothetical protein
MSPRWKRVLEVIVTVPKSPIIKLENMNVELEHKLPRSQCSHSALTIQFSGKPYSKPNPAAQPIRVSDTEAELPAVEVRATPTTG